MSDGNNGGSSGAVKLFIVTGFNTEQVYCVAEEVGRAFRDAIVFLAVEGQTETRPLTENPKTRLFAGKRGSCSHALKLSLSAALKENFRDIIIADAERIRKPPEVLKKIPSTGVEQKPAIFLMDESALVKENSRNPVFQIFRNFLFWIETGFRITLQRSPVVILSKELLNSLSMSPLSEGIRKEILVRAIWKQRPDIVPVSSTAVKKPGKKPGINSIKRYSQLFALHTWLILKSAFYIQPKNAIRLFTLKNLKAFVKRELFNPAEPTHIKAISVGVGIFCGIIPLWGWQTIIAITLSLSLRLNKMITITTSSISITPLLPLILYFSYFTGGLFLGDKPTFEARNEIDLEFIKVHFLQYFLGAFILAFIAGAASGLITWLTLKAFPGKNETA